MRLSAKVSRVKPIGVIDRSSWLFFHNLKFGGVLLLSGIFLVGCGSNPSGSVADSNANLSNSLIIEKAATIPVLDGKVTQAGVYVHNNTGKAISGIEYSSVVVGEYRAGSHLEINKLTDCSTIAANSSCLLSLSTPALTVGQSGSTVINVSYNGEHSKQLINYRYYATKDYNGVNFSDGSTSLYGTNDYATVYAFVGQSQAQDNVAFDVNNSSLGVFSGLINGKVNFGVNQVVPLEIHSNQNVISNLVTVTPYTATTSKQSAQALQSAPQRNHVLQVSISPTRQANLLMSDVPILTQAVSSATLTVVNNGNKPATIVGLNAANASVVVDRGLTNPCRNGLNLVPMASCNYTVGLNNNYSNGNTLLTLAYDNRLGRVTATQTVYFQNNNAAPMVSATPNRSTLPEHIYESDIIIFNISNIGNSPLNNAVITSQKTLTKVSTTIQNNTCTSTIVANSSCQLEVNVQASGLIDSGVIYLNMNGNNTNTAQTSYSFMSKPVTVTITDSTNPKVMSTTPQDKVDGVSVATSITVNFSEAMDPTTLNTTNIQLQKDSDNSVVATTLQGVTGNSQTVTFVLNGVTLAGTTKYKIVINPSQIKDSNGNAMNSGLTTDTVTTFTTTTVDNIAPVISGFIPTNGAQQQSKTPLISISFSEAMAQATLTPSNIMLKTQAGAAVTGYTISYNPSNFTAVLNLNGTELASITTYQLIVNQLNITDVAGNVLGSDANYLVTSFTTSDFVAPVLVNGSTVPLNGANNVSVNTPISLTFSESMDTGTLVTPNILLQKKSDGSNVALGAPAYSNGNKTVTFQPAEALLAGENYIIVINPVQIMDSSGNAVDVASSSTVVSDFSIKQDTADINFIGYSGSGSSNLYKSADGITWTQLANGSNIVFNYASSINYINTTWMMAGITASCGGGNEYCTSSFSIYDGTTWQNSTIYSDGSYSNQFNPYGGIAQGNGQTVVNGDYYTADYSNFITIFGSSNLTSWNRVYVPSTGGSGVTGVAFGNNAFVEVNYGGPANVLRSTDGLTFSPVSISGIYSFPYLHSVIYANNQFVVVGGTSATTSTGKPLILTSPDGLIWTNRSQISLDAGSLLSNIAYGNSTYVAIGLYTNTTTGNITKGLILTSSDGITWTSRNEGNMTNMGLYGIAYSSGKWIIVGSNGSTDINLTSSDNGVTWESGQTNIVMSYVAGNYKEISSSVKYIRSTPDSYTGNVGGIAGADSICVSNFGSEYKALMVDGINRYACNSASCSSSQDWVLHAGVSYVNASGQALFTANSKEIFIGNMSNLIPFGANGSGGGALLQYPNTGLNIDWTTNSNNCSGWTSEDSASLVSYGDLSSLVKWYADAASGKCSEVIPILCVQQ